MYQHIDNNLKFLGERIRAERKKLGWTQEEFAAHCRLDRSYIGGIERGERNLTIATLCQIAKAMKLNLSELTKNLPQE
jgi:transcriptional regulator with XRE-family HTH domain